MTATKNIMANMLDQNMPEPSKAHLTRIVPTTNLGSLEALPLELLYNKYLELDIRALVNINLSNREQPNLGIHFLSGLT